MLSVLMKDWMSKVWVASAVLRMKSKVKAHFLAQPSSWVAMNSFAPSFNASSFLLGECEMA